MSQSKIFVANWKMNKTLEEAATYVFSLKESLSVENSRLNQVIIAPQFTQIYPLNQLIKTNPFIQLAGQNCSEQIEGAFTGEVSSISLREAGASYVILGHSERRNLFFESDLMIAKKTSLALKAGITPIVCVGETLEDRKSHRREEKVLNQVDAILEFIESSFILEQQQIVWAYEPIWAIGTGQSPSASEIQELHLLIRQHLQKKIGNDEKMRIIYGGSVTIHNCEEIGEQKAVDGFILGTASLTLSTFLRIIKGKLGTIGSF